MSPYEIGILLHYHGHACDYPDMEAPIWKDTVSRFIDLGLLKDSSREEMFFEIAERGRVYCQWLMAVPLPGVPRREFIGWPRSGVEHLGFVCDDPACKPCVSLNKARTK